MTNWLEKSADQGYLPAQSLLGELLVDGYLVERDIGKGFELLLKSYRGGSHVAKEHLEHMADSLSARNNKYREHEKSK